MHTAIFALISPPPAGHLRQGHLSKPEELRAAARRDGHLPVQGGRLPHPRLPGLSVRVSPVQTASSQSSISTESRERLCVKRKIKIEGWMRLGRMEALRKRKNPITVDDGPLQTLNVLFLFEKNIVQFCFHCVDRSIKEKQEKKSLRAH